MKNREKALITAFSFIGLLVVGVASFAVNANKKDVLSSGTIPTYEMHFDSTTNKLTNNPSSSNGLATVKTDNGNNINFFYNKTYSYSSSTWQCISSDGSIYNTTPIHGLESITINFFKSTDSIIYWSFDSYSSYSGFQFYESMASITCDFNGSHPNYFKIYNNSSLNDLGLSSVNVVFNCISYVAPTTNNLVFTLSDTKDYYSVKAKNTSISGGLSIPQTYSGRPVTTIEKDGFHSCNYLTVVNIPDSITSVGEGAFTSCTSLSSVTIGSGLSTISKEMFYNCYRLKDVSFANNSSVTTIGQSAFYYCSNLESINLPNSIITINAWGFSGCSKLTSVIIPDSVTTISSFAFSNCTRLATIHFGRELTNIENTTFRGCTSLVSFTIDSNNANFSVIDGVLFNKNGSTLIMFPCGKSGSYVIPEGTLVINNYAFYICESVSSVILPSTLQSINNGGLYYCTLLENVYYNGTTSKWSLITLGSGWKNDSPFSSIICLDGVINL